MELTRLADRIRTLWPESDPYRTEIPGGAMLGTAPRKKPVLSQKNRPPDSPEAKAKEALACALSAAAKDAKEDPWGQSTEDRRIAREAQIIIDERFSENLSLQSIARELYVGKTRLCEVFREQIGSCLAEYLRDKRMSEARMLLETTDMKASEIADAVGYAHQSSFTGAFRKACGCSPSQWRKEFHSGL